MRLIGFFLSSNGPIAQSVEQETHNLLVPGSSPGGPTNHLLPSEHRCILLIMMNFIFISLLLFAGCQQQEQPRQYTEIVSQTSVGTSNPYSWNLPKGWKQGPNKEMRLASFYLEADPDAIDCYIVSLPGLAGGLEANLKRWMGQMGIDPSDANYQKLLNTSKIFQTREGLEAKFYDLMPLQQGPSAKTMIAAIVSTNDATVFVKMTGTGEHVKQNKDSFLEFLKSIVELIKN